MKKCKYCGKEIVQDNRIKNLGMTLKKRITCGSLECVKKRLKFWDKKNAQKRREYRIKEKCEGKSALYRYLYRKGVSLNLLTKIMGQQIEKRVREEVRAEMYKKGMRRREFDKCYNRITNIQIQIETLKRKYDSLFEAYKHIIHNKRLPVEEIINPRP